MGEDSSLQQLGALGSDAPSHSVGALSPIARRPFGGGSGGPTEPLWKGSAVVHGVSAIVARLVHRLDR
eukprot:1424402-Alexandrium_andersonii.AAC.1